MPNRSPWEPPSGEESPAIPSFASLRDPRRRTAVDVLMAGPPPVPDPPAVPVSSGPTRDAAPRATRSAPRPAEYADLLRFGMRVARAAASLPGCLIGWSVREPARCLRRLAG